MSSAASGHEVAAPELQRLSIVVPVDQGERTLDLLLAEIAPLTTPQETPQGRPFQVVEVVLVHDGAIDNSHVVMEALAARFPFVFLVWLSRNFGQHPATLAGMAATSADWVPTLDEDGQQNPADIARLLDAAFDAGAPLVYGPALNEPSHGVVRPQHLQLAREDADGAGRRQPPAGPVQQLPARPRRYRAQPGGLLRPRRLPGRRAGLGRRTVDHGAGDAPSRPGPPVRLHVPPPPRALRAAAAHGRDAAAPAHLRAGGPVRPVRGALSAVLVWARLRHQIPVQGYTSLVVVICFFSGVVLFSLGIIAEYLAGTLTTGMGRPLYVTVSRPHRPDGVQR